MPPHNRRTPATFVPLSSTFLPPAPRPVRRAPAAARRPPARTAPHARASRSSDDDFFLPLSDVPLLGADAARRTRASPQNLPIAQRRADAKRRELSRAAAHPVDDEDEERRAQLVSEELSATDLLGIVDARAVPPDINNTPPPRPPPAVPTPAPAKTEAPPDLLPTAPESAAASLRLRRATMPGKERTGTVDSVIEGAHMPAAGPRPSRPPQTRRTRAVSSVRSPMSAPPPPVPDDTLRPGHLVMHSRHGVGRFRGVERTVASPATESGAERPVQEFAVLEYRDGDVYVPFSHFDLIRRLSSEEAQLISRLDPIANDTSYAGRSNSAKSRRSKHSARTKTRANIRKQLVNLHGLYAERATIERTPFPVDERAEQEFAAKCSFALTADQEVATKHVFNDMSNSRQPMDRLLCGDVGFGKTEVAIRATFRALRAGKQVAILAPTTILAQQHYETFRQRFAATSPEFPLACLTRFVPRKEVVSSRGKIESGDIRIAIGTHLLLSDRFQFKNLGLLIVDEEHRFGVNQKEKIRSRYRGTDTLFMSATPIPRTLHLALSGLRDASVLRTPPIGRKPVITQVSPVGSGIVRQTINRELKRGGQVFYVVARIEGIEATANWLRDLFPKLRILVAHGSAPDLEHRIWAFARKEFDVLVCTTIIENGINMPGVNSVIIQDAGRFGLAQLHQLRGRVGRSDVQAYALMLFRTDHSSHSQQALNRLKALEKYSDLGSGFAIAQQDMEMRGVGTILGVEQHGNTSIGAEEYAKMLSEELEYARTGNPIAVPLPNPSQTTEIFLPVASFIPSEYIGDFDQKMVAYAHMSKAKSHEELHRVVEKLQRQFGALPTATRRHVSILELKLYGKALGISRIFKERQHIIIEWPVEAVTFKRLLALLPDKPSRDRCELLVEEERLVMRGLGICSGDVQLAKLRMYLEVFTKAATGFAREKDRVAPSPETLAASLSSLEDEKPISRRPDQRN